MTSIQNATAVRDCVHRVGTVPRHRRTAYGDDVADSRRAGRVLRASREMTSKRRGKERGLTWREGFDTTPHRSFDDVSEGPSLAACVNDSCASIANGMPTW